MVCTAHPLHLLILAIEVVLICAQVLDFLAGEVRASAQAVIDLRNLKVLQWLGEGALLGG